MLLLLNQTDPNLPKDLGHSHLLGNLSSYSTTTLAILIRVLAILLAIAGIILAITIWRKMRRRNTGSKIHPDMMYEGRPNPRLKTLPENQRDPKRTFTAKMREEKLDEQHGYCNYQKTIHAHPDWEAYRSGIQWEGDHIVPHAAGGATNYENLQVLCADCNSAKTDTYGSEATERIEHMWRNKRD
jgi:hypothetical protein